MTGAAQRPSFYLTQLSRLIAESVVGKLKTGSNRYLAAGTNGLCFDDPLADRVPDQFRA